MEKMEDKYLFVGGRFDKQIMTRTEVMSVYNGHFTADLTEIRKAGGYCHSPLLDNQPLVDGYLSPMIDGTKFRYETYDVYDRLSR